MNSSRKVFSLGGGGGGGGGGGVGWVIFVDMRSSGLDRVVVKLFFLWGIGLPEAEEGKVNGAFME